MVKNETFTVIWSGFLALEEDRRKILVISVIFGIKQGHESLKIFFLFVFPSKQLFVKIAKLSTKLWFMTCEFN